MAKTKIVTDSNNNTREVVKKKKKKKKSDGTKYVDYPKQLKDVVINKTTFDKKVNPLKNSISFINISLPAKSKFRIIKLEGLAVENISVTPSLPLFNGYDIPGRSSPIQVYNGGEARSISFSMTLHRDMLYPVTYSPEALSSNMQSLNVGTIFTATKASYEASKKTDKVKVGYRITDRTITVDDNGRQQIVPIREVLYQNIVTITNRNQEEMASYRFKDLMNQFEAMNYPRYSKAGVIPPTIYCEIGGYLKIRGIPNITINYQRPIDTYGAYMLATINVTITEVLVRSWDSSEVMENMVRYNGWSKQVNK